MPLPKKYRHVKRSLVVRRGLSGLGLFTKDPIENKGFVIEYTGKILTRKYADVLGGKYLFETSYDRFIDGAERENVARYINHSCDPNCEVDILRGRIYIFAIKKIRAGAELTYDYQKEYYDEHIGPHGCRCASERHRVFRHKHK